jgi:3-oxoadipate enol-lactonase
MTHTAGRANVAPDVELYWEIDGPVDGQPLLLISGTGNDLRADRSRDGTKPVHPLVAAGFRVIQYDQRGLGQSSKPDRPYSMAEYADDAAALIAQLQASQAISSAPLHTVGISFGGMVAQHVAIRHLALVRRLVLCCTSSGGPGGSSFDLLAVADLPDDERIRITASVMDTRNNLRVTPPVFAPGYLELAKRAGRANQLLLADPSGPIGARRQLEARAQHNVWDDLPKVTAHTLVCGGEFDNQAPPPNITALAARLPSAHVAMFDGGHAFLFQDQTAWPTIIEFLRS